MSRRNLYITLIALTSVIIVILLIIILTRDPKGSNGSESMNGNYDSDGTASFNIVLERTSLNIGDKTRAVVVFPNGESKEVRWYTSGPEISVTNNGEVVAIEFGNAKLCAELVSNSNEKKCVQITVSNIKSDFKTRIVNDYGYTQVSTNKYVKDKYTLDLNNKTFTFYEKTTTESMLSYHFGRTENYIESVARDTRYTVILKYNINTKQYDCEASPAALQEDICNSVKDTFLANGANMMTILEGYLEPNLTINDIN